MKVQRPLLILCVALLVVFTFVFLIRGYHDKGSLQAGVLEDMQKSGFAMEDAAQIQIHREITGKRLYAVLFEYKGEKGVATYRVHPLIKSKIRLTGITYSRDLEPQHLQSYGVVSSDALYIHLVMVNFNDNGLVLHNTRINDTTVSKLIAFMLLILASWGLSRYRIAKDRRERSQKRKWTRGETLLP